MSASEATYRAVAELMSGGDLARFGELVADDFRDHLQAPFAGKNKDGFKVFVTTMRSVFPDLRVAVEDVFVDGDKLAGRLLFRGVHRRSLAGVPATGRRVAISMVEVVRFAGGRYAERWGVFDQLGMMQQLGAFPSK